MVIFQGFSKIIIGFNYTISIERFVENLLTVKSRANNKVNKCLCDAFHAKIMLLIMIKYYLIFSFFQYTCVSTIFATATKMVLDPNDHILEHVIQK